MACPACIQGNIHNVETFGREATLYGIPTYISDPPNGQAPKGNIIYICDALGWKMPNNRHLADVYAQRTGCRVYTPDFFFGRWMDAALMHDMDYITTKSSSWYNTLTKALPIARVVAAFLPFLFFNRLSVRKPQVFQFVKDFRGGEDGGLPLGVAGFCWGGKLAFLLSHDTERAPNGTSLVDALFTAHPSLLAIPADIDAVKLPMSVCIGDVDMGLAAEKCYEAKKLLEQKDPKHEWVVLEGAKHGFAIRGHPDDEREMEVAQIGEDQAVNWFKKWLLKE